MDLRSLKKEAHDLLPLSLHQEEFEQHWLQPLQKERHEDISAYRFLNSLDPQSKEQIQNKLLLCKKLLREISEAEPLNHKIKFYARHLIEMKLTLMNGDARKSAMITNILLNDDFYKLQNSLTDLSDLSAKVDLLANIYNEINVLLDKKLSLEEALFFMELPHYKYIKNLVHIVKKQRILAQEIGQNFVDLARQARDRNR